MHKEELSRLMKTEQHCRKLLADTEAECAELLRIARQQAEGEYALLVEDAYKDAEESLSRAKEDMEKQKQLYLLKKGDEVRITCKNCQSKIDHAVSKISERMYGGYDRTNEPFQPFSPERG